MATVKVKFRASSVPGKEGTLYYHLIHQRSLRWISTDYHVFPDEWNDKKSAIIVSNRNNRQAHLQLILSQTDWEMKQMQRIIRDKDAEGISYTIDDIAKEIQQLPSSQSVFTFFRQQIVKKEQMQCIGTKSNYVSAANRFMEFHDAKDIVYKSKEQDFIIFHIDYNNSIYMPIADTKPKIGEKVYAIGSPRGLENTFSSGEISQWRAENLMQISALIDHGSSGGALINEYGEVVGITSGSFADGSQANLNYAWSIEVIKPYL